MTPTFDINNCVVCLEGKGKGVPVELMEIID